MIVFANLVASKPGAMQIFIHAIMVMLFLAFFALGLSPRPD